LIKAHEAEGVEPPETAFAPDAFPEADFYIEAFHALSTERQIGAMGGAGYIPWSKAMAFATDAGLTSADERDRFWRLIHKIDAEEYLPWLAEKQKSSPSPDK
jgi:hypothetical protein